MRTAVVLLFLLAQAATALAAQSELRPPWWGGVGVGNGLDAGRGLSASYGTGWVVGPRLLLGFEMGAVALAPAQMSLDGVAYFFPSGSPGPFLRIGLGPAVTMSQGSDDLVFGFGATAQVAAGWDLPLRGRLRLRPYISVAAGAWDALERVTVFGVGLSWRPASIQ